MCSLWFLRGVKVKQFHYRPWGFQEVEAPRFQDSRHMKVVRLSALRTGCLYPQEIFLVPISVRGWVDPRAIVLPEGLCQWKIPVTPSGIEPAMRHRVPPFERSVPSQSSASTGTKSTHPALRHSAFLQSMKTNFWSYMVIGIPNDHHLAKLNLGVGKKDWLSQGAF